MPPFANAHDHARAARSSSFGAAGKPLEIWLHYLAMLPAVDPYLASAVSLSHAALGGAGIVMVHYTRVQGLTDYVTEAKAVARAARDVGVRVGFAVALRDRNPLVYGPPSRSSALCPPPRRNPHASSARRCRSRNRSRSSMRLLLRLACARFRCAIWSGRCAMV